MADAGLAPTIPLHRRILDDVEANIMSGAWPPGHRIPSEQDLAVRYGCSRMTMNKVLTGLVTTGLIERRRKAGSFVRQPRSQSAVLEIKDIRAEVTELGLTYAYAIVGRRERPARRGDRAQLGLTREGAVLDIACRHFAAGRPFCLEERLISLDAVPEASAESFFETAPGPWLVSRVPWTAAEHHIRAVAADPATATHLKIAPASACLVIERRTWLVDRPVTFVRLSYPGEAHALVARFAP
jgi:GntR family histidine utilization transcriptional repressor